MCDGGLLWEIDENGIRTDYAYDTRANWWKSHVPP